MADCGPFVIAIIDDRWLPFYSPARGRWSCRLADVETYPTREAAQAACPSCFMTPVTIEHARVIELETECSRIAERL